MIISSSTFMSSRLTQKSSNDVQAQIQSDPALPMPPGWLDRDLCTGSGHDPSYRSEKSAKIRRHDHLRNKSMPDFQLSIRYATLGRRRPRRPRGRRGTSCEAFKAESAREKRPPPIW